MSENKVNEFLKRCWVNKLRLNVIAETPWYIEVHGDNFTAAKAREYLDKHQELEAELILKLTDDILNELIDERIAIREADNLKGGAIAAIMANMNRGY